VTRRRRHGRPPRLLAAPAPPPAPDPEPRATDDAARRLVRSGVWGPHPEFGRAEVRAAARAVAHATRGVTVDDLLDALVAVAGPQPASRAAIDADLAWHAAGCARARLVDLARAGERVAFATATPASLLPLHQSLASAARAAGARVASAEEAGPYALDRRLWWLGDVAVATDGHTLVEERRPAAGDEWLFVVGHPALVVADGVFAARAVAAGVPTLAFADLDEPALALAARRGRPVVVVPLARHRPPAAYAPLVATLAAVPVTHDRDAACHRPHLATETPFPYAAPPSGGEG